MPDESKLADYQDALLCLLTSGITQDELLEVMKTDSRFEGYQAYVKDFDPDMVAIAGELMGKWAKHKVI